MSAVLEHCAELGQRELAAGGTLLAQGEATGRRWVRRPASMPQAEESRPTSATTSTASSPSIPPGRSRT